MLTATRHQPEQRVVLRGISWQTYERLLDEVRRSASLARLTYDRGDLELMTTPHSHEWIKKMLARMIETLTLELGIPIKSGGMTTFKRRDLERGLEADECYWVQSEPSVRRQREIDLAVDPPPDLAVEVEITRSILDKLSVYAALGVGEVWRLGGERCHVLVRNDAGVYEPATASVALPMFPMDEIARLLARSDKVDETTLFRDFAVWVRRELGE